MSHAASVAGPSRYREVIDFVPYSSAATNCACTHSATNKYRTLRRPSGSQGPCWQRRIVVNKTRGGSGLPIQSGASAIEDVFDWQA